jgi:hypothetical protein
MYICIFCQIKSIKQTFREVSAILRDVRKRVYHYALWFASRINFTLLFHWFQRLHIADSYKVLSTFVLIIVILAINMDTESRTVINLRLFPPSEEPIFNLNDTCQAFLNQGMKYYPFYCVNSDSDYHWYLCNLTNRSATRVAIIGAIIKNYM